MTKSLIDVSEILSDPDLASTFDVLRRAETVDSHGRSVKTETVIPDVVGCVSPSSGNDLERLPDAQLMGRHITVVTTFRLRGPVAGGQPDIVRWEGDDFVVQMLDPYPQFGVGFVMAVCGSQDYLDQPVTE